MHSFLVGWQVYSAEIRKIFAYRADFWLQYLFSIFAHIGVAYFLWKSLFEAHNVTTMQGFTFSGIMFYYLLVPVVSRVIFGGDMGTLAREIYDGALTKYVIYPVSYFRYKFIQHLAYTTIYTLQMIFAIIVFAFLFGIPTDVHLSWQVILPLLVTLFLGTTLSFVISSSIELIAFWADHVWSLLVMIRFMVSLLGGGMIPLAFFPKHFAHLLAYTPFPYLTAYPVELCMGKIGLESWFFASAVTIVWIVLFALLTRLIWQRGKLVYTGVGI